MMVMDTLENSKAEAVRFGTEKLLTLPHGQVVSLAQGYIPRLVTFTFEDKAAKGLRKRGADAMLERPKYLSALEVVRDNKLLLLTGSAGSGKTTFAKYFTYKLTSPDQRLSDTLVRNEFGDVEEESWKATGIHPIYHSVQSSSSLADFMEIVPELLSKNPPHNTSGQESELQLVIDGIEKTGDHIRSFFLDLLSLSRRHENLRILVLGDVAAINRRQPPPDIARYDLLGLLTIQRTVFIRHHLSDDVAHQNVGTGIAAANPSIFSLALRTRSTGELAEATLDRMLSEIAPNEEVARQITESAFSSLSNGVAPEMPSIPTNDYSLLLSSYTLKLLTALYLSSQPPKIAVDFFRQDTSAFYDVLKSVLDRLRGLGGFSRLTEALIEGESEGACRGALLAADVREQGEQHLLSQVKRLVLRVVSDGHLSARERDQAGKILSRFNDPRDLTALINVPGGTFTFGSQSHPNSRPTGNLQIRPFRIGQFPVVNRDYAAFVKDTGRTWISPDGGDPDKQNVPATDLTWHDARAYCEWLTNKWVKEGRLDTGQIVRLPTEPEWERAARGDQGEPSDADGIVYPWGSQWIEDTANDEHAGLNEKCCVGMFPKGRSPYGCYDMAGQVWEWCTTLWGEDMATPSFQYPWNPEDGRENTTAPESVRRVLRGGCFSSGMLKASSTYRGSLEPAGFWRGNGFRIVVSENGKATP